MWLAAMLSRIIKRKERSGMSVGDVTRCTRVLDIYMTAKSPSHHFGLFDNQKKTADSADSCGCINYLLFMTMIFTIAPSVNVLTVHWPKEVI